MSGLVGADGKVVTLPSGLPANYYLPVDAILSVENGQTVKAGYPGAYST